MPSRARTERPPLGAGTWARKRVLIPAAALGGAALGATAATWLSFDRNVAARALVAAGLFVAALLTALIVARMGEERRWHRLADKRSHPATSGFVAGLAAQAEAAREFVGADGAAVLWTDDPRATRVAAVAGSVPEAFVPGAGLPPSALLEEGMVATTGWRALDAGDPCAMGHHFVAGRPLRLRVPHTGGLVVWSSHPTRWSLRRLASATRAGTSAIEAARLDDAERRSRLGASHARRHLAMLVSASATLARAIDDWAPAFRDLASEIVPLHADYFALDVLGNEGSLERVVGAHIDRSKGREAGDAGPQGLEVLASGEAVLLRAGQADRGHADLTRLELESMALMPLRARDAVIGALSVGTQSPRRGLRPSDVEAYEELAARCAQALERVKLYRATQAAARTAQVNAARLVRAVEAAPALASSFNVADLLERAARQAFRTMDGRVAAVRLDRDGMPPVFAWWPAVPTLHADAVALLERARSGGPWSPGVVGPSGGGAPRPWVAVPIVLSGSVPAGVLAVERPEGQEFSAEEAAVLLLVSQVTDAAIRHAEMYEASVTNERRLQALFEASPLAIIEVDGGGELRSANPAAVSLFRWAPPPGPRLLPPDVAGAFSSLRARISAGHTVVADRIVVPWDDGSTSSLSLAAALVRRHQGGDEDLLCIFTDVTQRDLLEREVQQKQRMEALGRMAGGVAHDFNNLLTVIVGYSDLLATRLGPGDPAYADVDAIRVAGQRAAAFTEQLLTISTAKRAEVRAVDFSRAVHDVEPVLRRLVGPDVGFSLAAEPGTGWIAIDEGQLEQVLLNLVVNARDAMPDGGLLSITTERDGSYVELVVRDTGVGMDADTLERCFDPFFTTKGRTKGTGLGLATVYGIVDQAGGEIGVESTAGVGTTFRVRFPAVMPSTARAAAVPGANAPSLPQGNARTVLLVEDEHDVRAYTRTVLGNAGYEVVEAPGAIEALQIAGTLTDPPAAVVTDVLLGGMTGPDLAHELRAIYPGLPVLFISGYVEDQRRVELVRETPASAFLAKPFTPSELLSSVATVLEARVTKR
jgi:signal transduction histidine kinase/ActR/RegA family two-component response regulator